MNEHELAERAESMVRHYRDAPKGAFLIAWRAMRLIERARDAARRLELRELVRGHGIPDDTVSRFACAVVENACRLPARGESNVLHALNTAHFMAVKVTRILRRKQVIATAPKSETERLTGLGWLMPLPMPEENDEQKPAH